MGVAHSRSVIAQVPSVMYQVKAIGEVAVENRRGSSAVPADPPKLENKKKSSAAIAKAVRT